MKFADVVRILKGVKMIGKIEEINKKTDVKGRAYETVKVNGEWLINQEEELQGVLCVGMEYDLIVEESTQLRVDGNPWPTKIKAITPVIDQSKPEPMPEPDEPSPDEPHIGQKTEPRSRDESIVRQVAYKVAGEALKTVDMKPKEDAMEMLQDFAHVIAVDILYGKKWGI